MDYLFTLCGRAGSKGFKNKNLKQLLGVPLVNYSLAVIALYKKMYGQEDRITVVLNTDSLELMEMVKQQDSIEVFVIHRTEDLAGDRVPKVSVIKDSLVRAEKEYGCKFDMVIDLDLTSPLRTVSDVKAAIDKKKEREDTDVVYSVTHSRRNPYFNMVKEENGYFVKAISSHFVARQQAPSFYDMNASIYAYSPKALLTKEANVFFNDRAGAIVMRDTAVLDIDGEEDFELMSIIADYLIKNYDEYQTVYQSAQILKDGKGNLSISG